MRVRFLLREAFPDGGLCLAAFRLAQALSEAGHDAEVLFGGGDPPPSLQSLGRRIDALHPAQALERSAADLVLVCDDSLEWLRAAAAVAPTLMHADLHWGVCADTARYWHRANRPCAVRAGWHCAALRPLLGCTDWRGSLDPRPLLSQQRLLSLLQSGGVGVVSVSTDQAELFAAHGIPSSHNVVVPNLGMRMAPATLREAAERTPAAWRSAIAFLGRLSKPKGAMLLPELANLLGPDAPLRVFGEGYLAPRLKTLPAGVRCGQIDQNAVAGVMMWARAAVFPSLWPEPGGIVGIDAQVMGVPLAAFDTGAARHWPAAARFLGGDIASMAAWLTRQAPRGVPRDAELVSAAQVSYWKRIARHATTSFEAFVRDGVFPPSPGAPVEHLMVSAADRTMAGSEA